jgi:hypothetical protein
MRTAILAGALGLGLLLPGRAAVAQNDPPHDQNPPAHEHGYHHGDGEGCYQQDDPGHGAWHDGHHDDGGRWHRGM